MKYPLLARLGLVLLGLQYSLAESPQAISTPPALPLPVSSFGAASSPEGHLYIYGGHRGERHRYSKEEVNGDLYHWKAGQPQWEKLGSHEPAQGASLLFYENRVYRIGGMAARNATGEKQDLWSSHTATYMDLSTGKWTALPDMPQPRSSHDSAILADTLYVIGGWSLTGGGPRSAEPQWHTTYLTLDLKQPNATWQSHPQPFQRRALAVHALGGQIYALGGMNSDEEPISTLSILDPSAKTWQSGPDLPASKLGGFGISSTTQGGALYASGLTGTLLRLTEKEWQPSGQLQHPRFFHRLLSWKQGQILALGGEGAKGAKAPPEILSPSPSPAPQKPAPATSVQADWPSYQGPRGDSTTPETGWLTDWPADGPPVAWQTQVGIGLSSCSVHGSSLYTAGNDGADSTTVFSLHLQTGALQWKASFPDATRCHAMSIVPYGPASTPTYAEGRLYMLTRSGLLLCLDATTGREQWRKDLIQDLSGKLPVYGYATSPLHHQQRIYLDIGGEQGSTVCLDAFTGKPQWQTGKGEAGYSSPRIISRQDTALLVLFKGEALEIRQPDTGTLLAAHPITTRDFCNTATPYIQADRILLSNTGSGGTLMLDWPQPQQFSPRWTRQNIGLLYNSAIPHGQLLLLFNDQQRKTSELHLLDSSTGSTLWQSTEIAKGVGLHTDDGHLIILSNNGELVLARPSPEKLDILRRCQVLQGKTNVQPVLSHHRLICKNNQGAVVCLSLEK